MGQSLRGRRKSYKHEDKGKKKQNVCESIRTDTYTGIPIVSALIEINDGSCAIVKGSGISAIVVNTKTAPLSAVNERRRPRNMRSSTNNPCSPLGYPWPYSVLWRFLILCPVYFWERRTLVSWGIWGTKLKRKPATENMNFRGCLGVDVSANSAVPLMVRNEVLVLNICAKEIAEYLMNTPDFLETTSIRRR